MPLAARLLALAGAVLMPVSLFLISPTFGSLIDLPPCEGENASPKLDQAGLRASNSAWPGSRRIPTLLIRSKPASVSQPRTSRSA